MSLRNLDNAYTKFFKKQAYFPQFKKKSGKQSFQLPQGCKIVGKRLTLPKVEEGIKIKQHREFQGKIKTVTISKNSVNQYFATLLVETENEIKPPESFNEKSLVGLDLGIKDFAILSSGEKISNPKILRNEMKAVKKLQRKVSSKVKGSKNRNKAKLKLAKKHLKIKNKREDFLHKLSHQLTHENQVCGYAIEDLAVANMVKNHKLAQAISDSSWSKFINMLKYKSEWYGKHLIQIGRFEPSSKMCSACGSIKSSLELREREWICSCGVKHDRDINAASNIRNFGLLQYRRSYGNSEACGDDKVIRSSKKIRKSSKKQETQDLGLE
jgi:putative transposase